VARPREQRSPGLVVRTLAYSVNEVQQPDVWWEIRGSADVLPSPLERGDFAAVALVFFAMRHRADLHIDDRVSRSLLRNLEEFVAVWSLWRPDLYRRIRLSAREESGDAPAEHVAGEAIAAFSGGVDASFTFYRHAQGLAGRWTKKVKAAALIYGLVDIPLGQDEAYEVLASRAQATLASLDIPLVRIKTNSVQELCTNWGMEFGTYVAAALMHWQRDVSAALIGSDEDYANVVFPWGGNPITYPMLSTDSFRVMYDGAGTNRTQKVGVIAAWETGTETLRVCWQSASPRNCGRCEKCMRTKLNYLASRKPIPSSLPGGVPLSSVLRMKALAPANLALLRELHQEAKANGVEGAWVGALKLVIAWNRVAARLVRPYWIGRKLVARLLHGPTPTGKLMPAAGKSFASLEREPGASGQATAHQAGMQERYKEQALT
jgi:hypothetical protein